MSNRKKPTKSQEKRACSLIDISHPTNCPFKTCVALSRPRLLFCFSLHVPANLRSSLPSCQSNISALCEAAFAARIMATVVPPPSKKAKLEARRVANAAATASSSSAPAPNVVVQFTSSKDGSAIGPPVRLPADTDRAGLELLANKLAKATNEDDEEDDEPTPYSFHVSIPAQASEKGKEKEGTRVPVLKDLQDILKKNESSLSVEDVLTVVCEPEAIFKVRQVTRCSSTLSGKCSEYHA